MDQLSKQYGATIFSAVTPVMRPLPMASSFGYKKGASAEDCFGVLFEALTFSLNWGTPLVLGAQDVRTAFDSVEHADAARLLRQSGALTHQVLAVARVRGRRRQLDYNR